MTQAASDQTASDKLPDSPYAVARLLVTLALMTVGASGMYVIAVVLPTVQAEFDVARADASMPYTFLLIGFGVGGMLMGYLADRFGVMVPLLISAVGLGAGYCAASMAGSIWGFTLAHGFLIGLLGSSASFAPLIADTSLWFVRRRGIAVAVCASGNYLSGAIWPPIVQHFVYDIGWRQTYLYMGLFSFVATICLALLMRRRPPLAAASAAVSNTAPSAHPLPAFKNGQGSPALPFGLSPGKAQALLCIAGVGC